MRREAQIARFWLLRRRVSQSFRRKHWGRECATADRVGGKRRREVNLTSGCHCPLENVWCLSSLLNAVTAAPH